MSSATNARTAARPGSEPEQLRLAYLDLLKLAISDLAGDRTETAVPVGPNLYERRELGTDDIYTRLEGREWPLRGLTMVGLARLDDLQACVESVVADGIEGDLIEAGVWRGGASILTRATLDSLGDSQRTVVLADSFQGLPAPDSEHFPEDEGIDLNVHPYLAIPAERVRANFARFGLDHGIELVEGFFDQTLPGLTDRTWSLIRLDGDLYESTWVTLEALYPGLSVGGYVIVDDYGDIEACKQAVDDFRREYGIGEPLEHVDHTCVRWRRVQPAEANDVAGDGSARRPKPASADPEVRGAPLGPVRILTARERELEDELAETRKQLLEARETLERAFGATSWRLTEPFRRLGDRIRERF